MASRALPDLVSRLRLLFDDKEPTQAADRVTSRFESMGQRVSKALVPIGATLTGVGAGLTALSQPAQRAERVLKQAIDNTGKSYAKFDDQIDRTIDRQVRFGNNSAEVRQALTNLTIKLHDPQRALEELGLATDIAELKQISLAEAANLVAGAVNGSARVYKQFGITLDSSKPKAEAVEEAMAKLRATVRGFAEGEADTAVGKLESFRTKLENIGAEIGQKAGPAIAGLGAALTTVGGAADGIESIGNILDKLPGKAAGVGTAIGGIGLAAGGTFIAVKALGALDEALERSRRGTQDLDAVSAALVKLARGAETLNAVLASARVGGGVDSLVSDLRKLRDAEGTFDEATLAASFKKHVDDLDKGLAQLVQNNHAGQAAAAFNVLNDSLNLTPTEKARFFNDYAAAVAAAGHAAVVAGADTDIHTDALDRNAEALNKVAEAVDRQLQAQLASISSSLGYEGAIDRVTDSQQDLKEKADAVTKAIKEHKAGSVEATAAQEALSDAERGLRDAAVGAATAAVRLAQDQAAANKQSFDGADANAVFKAKLQELAAQIGGPTAEALRILAQGIHDVPGQKDVQFQMLGLEASIRNVERLNVAIDRAAARGTTVKPRLGQAVPELAGGGRAQARRPHIVGEDGPELFIPDISGRVVPNSDLRRTTSTDSGSMATAERVSTIDEAALTRVMVRAMAQVTVNMDSRPVGQVTRSRRRALS